jgi:hypothetical protein
MKFLRLDLLTLLISLFILGSCKNQNDIGLPVGGDQLNGTLLVYDDIVVKTDTDNVPIATGLAKTPLSALNDKVLGETQAIIATGLNLPNSAAYTVPTGTITTDSVVLELRYANGFYGDSLNSRYKLNVYQLKDKPSSSQAYASNKHWERESTLLNDPSKPSVFNARPTTPFKITSIVKGAKDTLKLDSTPHLRIALAASFFNNNLFNAPASQIASNSAFQNAVKGLYLQLQRNQPSETGGTFMFNLSASRVNVYYRVVNAGVTDTASVALPLTTYNAEVTRTESAAVTAARTSSTSDNLIYLQGLAGLRAKVSFPNLKSLFGTADLNTIAINRAELVVTTQSGTDLPPFVPQPLLTLYRLNIAKQRVRVPDANADLNPQSNTLQPLDARFFGAGVFGGNYLPNTKEYHFVVTGYIEDLLKGRLIDYGTYIAPIDVTNRNGVGLVDIASTIQTAGRVILVGSDKSSPQRIKLNVIYTKNN